MPAKFFSIAILLTVVAGCDFRSDSPAGHAPALVADTSIRYAKRFAVAHAGNDTYLYLFGNRSGRDTTAVFVLHRSSSAKESVSGSVHYINVPCRKIASLSSIYTQVFFELGALPAVKAIDNIDYVTNAAVIRKFQSERLPELARTPDIDVEQTLALRPDIVFTYGMGDGSGSDPRLAEAGIPVAVLVDHLEETPLARAEWIKFFAEFVGKRALADSVFEATRKKYEYMRAKAAGIAERPSVFSEIRYSDAWYMPGGKSYIATLIRDAGGRYLWEDDNHTGSLPLSFEEVFARAGDADYWINLSMVKSRAELLSFERRYAHFRAFKNGNLFNNNRHTNKKGYSDYWESGMIHPERILSDLVVIFHRRHADDTTLYYYTKIR